MKGTSSPDFNIDNYVSNSSNPEQEKVKQNYLKNIS